MRARARDCARVRSHGAAWGRMGCRVGTMAALWAVVALRGA